MFGRLTCDVGAPGVVDLPAAIEATDGLLEIKNDGTYAAPGDSGNWVTPAAAPVAAMYEVRAKDLAGDTAQAVGTFDTWLSLDTTRQWGANAGGFLITFTLEIRDKLTQVVRDSSSCTCSTSS